MAGASEPFLKDGKKENDTFEMKTMQGLGAGTGRSVGAKQQTGSSKILDLVKGKESTDVDSLNELIKIANRDDVNVFDEDKKTALHHASLNGEVDVVEVLLENGADIKYKTKAKTKERTYNYGTFAQEIHVRVAPFYKKNIDSDGNNALHLAVDSGVENAAEIFKLLLPSKDKLQNMSICNTRSVCSQNCRQHFRSGADCWLDNATSTNNKHSTVLDLALQKISRQTSDDLNYCMKEIIGYIVRETDIHCFLKLMRNVDSQASTPMRKLIEKVPETAKEALDRCIEKKTSKIIFHYELLDDVYFLKTWPPKQEDYCKKFNVYPWEKLSCKDAHTQRTRFKRLKTNLCDEMTEIESCKPYTNCAKKMKHNNPLMLMIKRKQTDTRDEGIYQELLDHPLVKALVMRKWRHIGKKFHILNLILYLIFLMVLTMCVVTAIPPYMNTGNTKCGNSGKCQTIHNDTTIPCQNGTSCLNSTSTPPRQSSENVLDEKAIALCVLAVIMLLKEGYQLVKMYGCLHYLKQKENYVEVISYVFAGLFVLNLTGRKSAAYTENWHWLLGTVSVFLAWINLLSFAKKFEHFGIYVMMLWSIIVTFLKKVFIIVAILLIAFTIVFNCVRRDKVEFRDFGHSLLSTAAMTVSGLEYDPGDFQSLAEYDDIIAATYIFYSLFLVLMTIIIINLMVGVAVENVQEMHRAASVSNSIHQIEYFLEFEGILCCLIKRFERFNCIKLFKKWFVLNPTEEIWLMDLKSSGLPQDTVEEILRLVNDEEVAKHDAIEKHDIGDLQHKMDVNTRELTDIKEELVEIRNIVKAIEESFRKWNLST